MVKRYYNNNKNVSFRINDHDILLYCWNEIDPSLSEMSWTRINIVIEEFLSISLELQLLQIYT